MDFPFSQPRCVVCHVQRPFDAFPHRGRVCVHCEDAGFRRIPTEPSMPQPPTPPNRGRGRPRTSSRLGGSRNRARGRGSGFPTEPSSPQPPTPPIRGRGRPRGRGRGRRNSSTVRPGQYPEPSPRPLGRPPVLSPPAHTVRPIARLPLAFYSERHRWREHRLGRMNVECPFCRALHWMEERVTGSSMRSPAFSKCCLQGKVPLQTLPAPIASIANLMQDAGPEGTHFRANSRHYNSALSLTSVNFKTDRRIGAGGPIPFQIQGELYHLQGPLDGDADTPPLYAQLWFHDPQYANDVRLQRNSTIKPMVLSEIQHGLWLCNRWVHVYTTAREQLLRLQSRLTPISVLLSPNLRLIQEEGTDQRRYNVPVTDEVGVVVPPLGPEYKRRTFRDLQLTLRGGGNGSGLTRVDPTHPLYCPLAYVILFSRGDEGWGWHCRLRDKSDGPEPTAGDDGDIGHGQLGDPDSVFTDPQSVLEPGEQHVATLDEVVEQAADDLEDDDLEGDDLEDDDRRAETGGRLTHRMWHSFHIHVRPDAFNPLQRSGRLYQQFLVDAAATTDQMKLQWFLRNQSRIRADLYVGLLDALEADEVDGGVNDTDLEGRRVILPSSHTGSERFMIGCYHDAMAIVTYMGKPNLFITMTANPAWPEITAELPPGQSVQDRPDIVARVFEMKKRALLDDLCKRQVFGPAKSRVWTIEYQKRGLPHVHLLLWLEDADRYLQPDIMDQVIFARLPTATEDPDGRLTAIVRKAMIHGPCGELNPDAPCMRDGKCSKNFPKPFQQQTTVPNDGYPSYFRPDNPGTSFVKDTGNRQFHVDNRWVVPYSPYLTLRYGAHINVEVCNSIEAVKYLFKYVYKGGDRATAEVEVNNEIHEYLDGRYIGPTEAAWRLLAFRFHEEFPPVQRLTVHEEGMQPVYFPEELTLEENRDRLRRHLETARTPLMAYFHYNSNAPESEPRYLYPDMPRWFTWNRSTRLWQTRKKGFAIGRIGFCSPAAGDKYFLRLLLLRRVGPKSYDDIRTVEGHLYPTYRAACAALGLLEDDQEWFLAFEEAVRFSSGRALRMMFVFGLVYTSIGDPGQLWDRFKHGLCDDLNYRLSQLPFVPDFEGRQYDYGLYLIGCDLRNSGKSLDSFGLPLPTVDWDAHMFPYDGSREEAEEDCRRLAADMVPRLNHDQRRCFDTVLHAVLHGTSPSCFFVQGAGGTGKTFLYRSIYYQLRSLQKTVICVASSGIASLLLPGGQTAHSCFKIPLRLDETTTCNITPRSDAGKWLLRADLIIWDEVVMQHRIAFEAVHRLLCDLRHDDRPFGGVPVLLGGDFAQTLPVVERGSRSAIVGACLIRSFLWQHLEVLLLRENMRLQGGDINSQFGAWLGRISYEPLFHGTMSIPQYVSTVHDLSWLCERVYPARELSLPQSDEFFASRAILTVRNADLTSINDYVTDAFRGEARPYFSSDVADVGDVGSGAADQLYSREYLASIEHPGLPPSVLRLKIGMPVMLLRNLRRQDGLCNGTRLIIVGLHRRVIQARKIGLSASDDTVYTIPRIQLQTPENYLPFTLQRRQFPIRPCFAMTVNKSQGQSLRHVGIDLRMSVFTHGQLYVALSRTTDVTGLTVLLPPDQSTTENVVYPEVLQPFAAISEEEYEYE